MVGANSLVNAFHREHRFRFEQVDAWAGSRKGFNVRTSYEARRWDRLTDVKDVQFFT
jgi:hypothetical protein